MEGIKSEQKAQVFEVTKLIINNGDKMDKMLEKMHNLEKDNIGLKYEMQEISKKIDKLSDEMKKINNSN